MPDVDDKISSSGERERGGRMNCLTNEFDMFVDYSRHLAIQECLLDRMNRQLESWDFFLDLLSTLINFDT